MKVIALDPGVTTGYATGTIVEGEMFVATGEGRLKHLDLWMILHTEKPDIVISESFEFRNQSRKGLELYSRELIGVTHLYAQMEGVEVTLQNPLKDSETTFFNDNKLKQHHIHKPGKGHANDAARHLLTWYQFRSGYQYNKKGFKSAA